MILLLFALLIHQLPDRSAVQTINAPSAALRESLMKRIAVRDFAYLNGLADRTMDRLTNEPLPLNWGDKTFEQNYRFDIGCMFARAELNSGNQAQAMKDFQWAATYNPSEPPIQLEVYKLLRKINGSDSEVIKQQIMKLQARQIDVASQGKYYPGLTTKAEQRASLNLLSASKAMSDGDFDVEGTYVIAAEDALPHNVFVTEWAARIRWMQKRWQASWNLWIEAYNLADDQERVTMGYNMNAFVADLHANHVLVKGDIPLQRVGHK